MENNFEKTPTPEGDPEDILEPEEKRRQEELKGLNPGDQIKITLPGEEGEEAEETTYTVQEVQLEDPNQVNTGEDFGGGKIALQKEQSLLRNKIEGDEVGETTFWKIMSLPGEVEFIKQKKEDDANPEQS